MLHENVGAWSISIKVFTSNGELVTTLTEDGEEVDSKKAWVFEGESRSVHINAYNFPIWGMLEKIASTSAV